MVLTVQCEGYNVGGRWIDCDRTDEHGHGIGQDAYSEQRERELQPLADALAIVVRGATNVKVEQTGGQVYCATAKVGAWTVYANEEGWSIEDEEGYSVAVGDWYEDEYAQPLTVDEDTGTLDADECDAAVHRLAGVIAGMLAPHMPQQD